MPIIHSYVIIGQIIRGRVFDTHGDEKIQIGVFAKAEESWRRNDV